MSAKNRDEHNRFRSKTVAFRVSPEEWDQINLAASLTGITKQDYIIKKLLDRTIVVQGNCKVHRAVIEGLQTVSSELHRIAGGQAINDELLSNITLIGSLVESLYTS